MADYEFNTVTTDGNILIVEMNRPEKMNALHPPANKELGEIFDDFASNPDLWVAIITGAGDRAFSAGNDLRSSQRHLPTLLRPSSRPIVPLSLHHISD